MFYPRSWLAGQLGGIIGNTTPLAAKNLADVLSKFSAKIIPPTLGIITGKSPSMAAYLATPNNVLGIENAVNAFAAQNASGMAIITGGLFTGTAPPPLKNTQPLYDYVRKNNKSKEFLCKGLANAIYINWTLGRSTFTPLPFPIPSWNIPALPGVVRDEVDMAELENNARIQLAKKDYQEAAEAQAGEDGILGTEDDLGGSLFDTDEFFEESAGELD